MSDLLLRDIPDSVIEVLTRRAQKHGRTLQQELRVLLALAALEPEGLNSAQVAETARASLARSGRDFGDSVDDLRADRER